MPLKTNWPMNYLFIMKILLGISLGLFLGLILPDSILAITESARITLNEYLGFFIPLIVLAFIGAGIADMQGRLGKLLGSSVLLAYVDTIIAIALSLTAAYFVIPMLTGPGESVSSGHHMPDAFFELEIQPPFEILSALLLAFILGIGATWEKSTIVRQGLLQFRDIILWSINKLVLPVIPYFVSLTFIKLSAEGEIFGNLPVFVGMILLIIGMQWLWLIIEYAGAALVTRTSPFAMMKAMIPAYFTGLGTMSSAVTMPVALRQAKKVDSVDPDISNFAIPLFNNVHQACGGIGIAIGAMTVSMLTTGHVLDFSVLVPFVILLGIIEVGAVGIPGGSILAAVGILQSTLGFGQEEIGIMFTLFAIQDGFAAAGNVTGDGALTMVVNHYFRGCKDP